MPWIFGLRDTRQQSFFSPRDAMSRVCSYCETEFTPNNGKQRFCADRCRRDFQTTRRREERWAGREREREQRVAERRAAAGRGSWKP
jgi:hypothetical protein